MGVINNLEGDLACGSPFWKIYSCRLGWNSLSPRFPKHSLSNTHTEHTQRERGREELREWVKRPLFIAKHVNFSSQTQERDGWVLHLNTTMPTLNIWNIFPSTSLMFFNLAVLWRAVLWCAIKNVCNAKAGENIQEDFLLFLALASSLLVASTPCRSSLSIPTSHKVVCVLQELCAKIPQFLYCSTLYC